MKIRNSALLAGAAVVGLVSAREDARAQQLFSLSDFYVSGGLGISLLDDNNFELSASGYGDRLFEYDTGFAGSLAIGTRVHEIFRIEGELSYRANDLGSVTIQNEGPQDFTGGDASAFAAMMNVWFDLPVIMGHVRPYVGGGIGGAEVSISANTLASGPCTASSQPCEPVSPDASDFVFAYQLGTGVAVALRGGLQLTLDYRFFHTDAIDVSGVINSAHTGRDFQLSEDDFVSHSVMIGLRMPLGGGS